MNLGGDVITNALLGVFAVSGILALLTGAAVIASGFFHFRRRVNDSLNMNLEMVKVALGKHADKNQGSQGPEGWKEEIAAMEQLLASLATIRPKSSWFGASPFDIVFEIANPSDSEEIFFYVAFPRRYREAVEKQVHSFFPDSVIELVQDYTIFSPTSQTAMSVLGLKDTYAIPLMTYQDMSGDPFNEISNALSKLDTVEEGAVLQLVLRPAQGDWRNSGRKLAHDMQQGKQLKDVRSSGFSRALGSLGSGLIDTLSPGTKKDSSLGNDQKNTQLTPEEQELVKAIERKTSKAAFRVNVRLLTSARTQERADQILSHLENAFGQFERSDLNFFKVQKRLKKKDIGFQYILRTFDYEQSILLSVDEIVSIFHFPISTTKTPKIKWLKAGAAPPPINIPQTGLRLGYNTYRGNKVDIRLSDNDRLRHLYVIGQTGVGKSNFLQELAKQDVNNKKGMCFIDPHGDAIDDILSSIPKERFEDIIHLNPADTERPIGLNMMEFTRPEEKTFVINEIIAIFDKLYDLKSTGGPMFEQYMRNAMLLVMEDEESGSTLLEIPRVLADEEFRKYKISKCKNSIVRDFWTKEAEKAGGEAALQNIVPYITSKLTQFITNDMMRPIISQQKSTINFREIMDEGKILLVNLSKGRIGEMNSHLLGMIVVGKLLMAALSRADIAEKDRKYFYLYIDEFQNVTTDSISQILSEARKYRLSLTLAHQFIGQLSEDISKAVFGNVGSLCAFRVGTEDAEFLEKQFSPVFSASDLMNVDNFNAFARVLINNESTKPFNIATYPPTDGNLEQISLIKEYSSLKYGRSVQVVEREIEERVNRRLAPEPKPIPSFGSRRA